MLELPLEEVPHFYQYCLQGLTESQQSDMRWWEEDAYEAFVESKGYESRRYGSKRQFDFLTEPTYVMTTGKSPRGVWHIVIGLLHPDGSWEMVFDPHPSDAGIDEPASHILLVKTQ
jgi:hypothetical protein